MPIIVQLLLMPSKQLQGMDSTRPLTVSCGIRHRDISGRSFSPSRCEVGPPCFGLVSDAQSDYIWKIWSQNPELHFVPQAIPEQDPHFGKAHCPAGSDYYYQRDTRNDFAWSLIMFRLMGWVKAAFTYISGPTGFKQNIAPSLTLSQHAYHCILSLFTFYTTS